MSYKIIISNKELQIKVNEVLIRKLNSKLDLRTIEDYCKSLVEKTIVSSPAWQSLSSSSEGSLGADFGFRKEEVVARLSGILKVWIDSIKIKKKIKQRKRSFVFELHLYGIREDFGDVLKLKEAITKNFSRSEKKVEELPWLEWLVLRGDSTVISGFKIEYGSYPRNQSRSGSAIMTPEGSFSVNPSFSGIRGENFITRSIEKLQSNEDIKNLIIQEIKRALK